jgi:hypothetical protein
MVPWKDLRGPACGQAGFLKVKDVEVLAHVQAIGGSGKR